eukprot:14797918-Heterocapsa_arctica.AAC.1
MPWADLLTALQPLQPSLYPYCSKSDFWSSMALTWTDGSRSTGGGILPSYTCICTATGTGADVAPSIGAQG